MRKTLEEMTADGHGLKLDFIDFPTAFAVQALLDDFSHHPECSSHGPFVCDCDAMPLKWAELKTAFDGSDGLALAEPYLTKHTESE